jgi:hypothetical protein
MKRTGDEETTKNDSEERRMNLDETVSPAARNASMPMLNKLLSDTWREAPDQQKSVPASAGLPPEKCRWPFADLKLHQRQRKTNAIERF